MRDAEYDYGLEAGERFEPDEELDEPFDLRRPHVMTALGPVDPGALGFTLPGEYLISRLPGGDPDHQLDDVAKAVAELEGYALTGGRALVDLTTADAGRNVEDVLWVAQRVPVHIVLATGHLEHLSPPDSIRDAPIAELAVQIIRELTDGINGTDVRAGVIVAGTGSDCITPVEARVLRAAAEAHRVTGAPLTIRAVSRAVALDQLTILADEGVVPNRITAGGFDVMRDEAGVRRLLDAGAFVCAQGWGGSSDDALAATVNRLVDAGYREQILISGGFARRSQWLAYGGGPGFVHFIDQAPLTLMDAGLDAPTVRQIFVENPARALTAIWPASR